MINKVGRCIFWIYLLVLSNDVVVLGMLSPCLNYFRYIRNDNFETMGQIEIPSPPKNVELRLKIELSLAAKLPSKYVGRIELEQSKEESVRIVQRGGPLFYLVHFPLIQPLPVLTNLWFNEKLYCSGPPESGRIVTSIVLLHTLFLPRVITFSANPGNNHGERLNFNKFNPPFEQIWPSASTSKPLITAAPPIQLPSILPQTTLPPLLSLIPDRTLNDKNYAECGLSNTQDNDINPLIAKGTDTNPGQWPWVVAIFIVKIKFEFQCTGTLITNKHIVTVAHCTRLDDLVLPPSTILVSLGRYRLRDWRGEGSVNREIKEYKIHPDYKGDIKDPTADADLAIMTLRETVEFSTFIRPICLWTGSNDLRDVVGSNGYVIGWGKNEFGKYLTEPRMAVVPIVSQEDCLWSNAGFIAFTSNRTLCAGSRNGSGPCNGDSGSGLVIRRKDGRYYLKGIVSRSILDRNTGSCDLTNYVVYVDASKHLNWIRLQIIS